MRRVEGVAEACDAHTLLELHQFIILIVFNKRHTASNAALAIYEAPREETDCCPAVQQEVQLASDAFGGIMWSGNISMCMS
jgi:hypothetical protein